MSAQTIFHLKRCWCNANAVELDMFLSFVHLCLNLNKDLIYSNVLELERFILRPGVSGIIRDTVRCNLTGNIRLAYEHCAYRTEFHSDHDSKHETFSFVVNQLVTMHFAVEDTLL